VFALVKIMSSLSGDAASVNAARMRYCGIAACRADRSD
jgi:hypothetical protein